MAFPHGAVSPSAVVQAGFKQMSRFVSVQRGGSSAASQGHLQNDLGSPTVGVTPGTRIVEVFAHVLGPVLDPC